MNEPWSKKHKKDFKKCKYSLSNSFAQPLNQSKLEEYLTKERPNDASTLLYLYRNHDLEYVPNGGSFDLREDIAKVIYDNKISPENILVFPGGQVALQTAALAFASNGVHSIVFTPGYQSTVESPLWAMDNKGITQIPMTPENNWQVDPQKLRNAIREDTKFLILNEPHNPSGIVMSKELQKEVIDICDQHDIVILCDEVYRLLEHDEKDRIPAMATAHRLGISAVTMSKPYGACGVTIGWLACNNNLGLSGQVQRLIDVQYFGCACVSRASEIQARMILAAHDAILQDRIEIIQRNKRLLQDFIENSKYSKWFSWNRPNAGAICYVKFHGPLTSGELGKLLAEEDTSVSMKPAYCFSNDVVASGTQDYFRVGFGEIKMPLALEELKKFVDKHEGGWNTMLE